MRRTVLQSLSASPDSRSGSSGTPILAWHSDYLQLVFLNDQLRSYAYRPSQAITCHRRCKCVQYTTRNRQLDWSAIAGSSEAFQADTRIWKEVHKRQLPHHSLPQHGTHHACWTRAWWITARGRKTTLKLNQNLKTLIFCKSAIMNLKWFWVIRSKHPKVLKRRHSCALRCGMGAESKAQHCLQKEKGVVESWVDGVSWLAKMRIRCRINTKQHHHNNF